MRLNKYLMEAGICSRREADKLIKSGRVTVDGREAELGMSVSEGQNVMVGKRAVKGKNEKVVLAFYKPKGVECTESKLIKNNVVRAVNYPVRVSYAGRLDRESEGLILMTNDGDLAEKIMRGRNGHEKEYQVRVDKEVTKAFVSALENGVRITDREKGIDQVTRRCRAEKTGKYTLKIILTQGINRQIRRMAKACGYQVKMIRRIRIMNVTLRGLLPGQYRMITGQELRELYEGAEFAENEGACENTQ